MKNLLNCHCIGLHSFPISLDDNGLYKRIFYADKNHELWKPYEIAIHPHHVDIKITILKGELYNPIYKVNKDGIPFKKFLWNSHILNGKGGFKLLGIEKLIEVSRYKYIKGQSVIMKACELHTVFVQKDTECAWMIEEAKPTCDYFPINYSQKDLENWNTEGLYIEVDNTIKDQYLDRIYCQIKRS